MPSITITKEQFEKAIKKANDEFINETREKAMEKGDSGELTQLLMMLQNNIFGNRIKNILFNENNGGNE